VIDLPVGLIEVTDERFADLGHDWAMRRVDDRAFSELGRPPSPAARALFDALVPGVDRPT
jgi:hypothetical protein